MVKNIDSWAPDLIQIQFCQDEHMTGASFFLN